MKATKRDKGPEESAVGLKAHSRAILQLLKIPVLARKPGELAARLRQQGRKLTMGSRLRIVKRMLAISAVGR